MPWNRCEKCEAKAKILFPMLYANGDKLMVCRDCLDDAELAADMEYERQREEGLDETDSGIPKGG